MKLSIAKVRSLGKQRDLCLTSLLERSGVSRTAFYSLARRDSVFPKTIKAVARTLGVSPLDILEQPAGWLDAVPTLRLEQARRIIASAPAAEFQNVWHTLALLELPPVERLNRSLLRGRSHDFHV